jgi:ribose 5-phosphate isomerase B
MLTISIGADHRGFALKNAIVTALPAIAWTDIGAQSADSSDYPVFAKRVVAAVSSGQATLGVLICGSGVGMAIAANRTPGIFAGLCWRPEVASIAREHDGINVLVLPADFITVEQACAIVQAWLAAKPLGGRYQERLASIDDLD